MFNVLLLILSVIGTGFFALVFAANCINGEYKKALITYSIYFVLAIFTYGFSNII